MGYAFLFARVALSRLLRIQSRITASSTEAEYLGLLHSSKEAILLCQLLKELGCLQTSTFVPFQ
jgi:hypothetical protein